MSEATNHTSVPTDSREDEVETEWVKTTVKVIPTSSKEDYEQEKALRLGECSKKKKPYIKTISFGELKLSNEKNKMTSRPFLSREIKANLVKAALLKTSLSDVLRKNMASEKIQADKEKKMEQLDSCLNTSSVRFCPADECKVPVDSKKKPTIKTESHHFVGARKTATPLVVRHEHISKQNATVPVSEDCTTYEPIDIKPDISLIKIEPGIRLAGPRCTKVKKTRKRHFKGATYGLYLTPARRKRKSSKKTSDTNSKDDEMSLASTENGSFVDSDGSSLFSDFTTSDKSLADDEVCLSSRCSPVLLPSGNQHGAASGIKEIPLFNENRDNSNFCISNTSTGDKSEPNNSKFSTSVQNKTKSAAFLQIERNIPSDKCHSSNTFSTNHPQNTRCLQENEILIIKNIKQEIIDDDDCKIIAETSAKCKVRRPGDSARKSVKNCQPSKVAIESPDVIKFNPDFRENPSRPSVSTHDGNETRGFPMKFVDPENSCVLQENEIRLTIKNIKKEIDDNESKCKNVDPTANSSKKPKPCQSARKSRKNNQHSKIAVQIPDMIKLDPDFGENLSQLPADTNENVYDTTQEFLQKCGEPAKFPYQSGQKFQRNNHLGNVACKTPDMHKVEQNLSKSSCQPSISTTGLCQPSVSTMNPCLPLISPHEPSISIVNVNQGFPQKCGDPAKPPRQSARKSPRYNHHGEVACKTSDMNKLEPNLKENARQPSVSDIVDARDRFPFPQKCDSEANPPRQSARKSRRNNCGKAASKTPGNPEISCGLQEKDILLTIQNMKQELDDKDSECKIIEEYTTDTSKISKRCSAARKPRKNKQQNKLDAKIPDIIKLDPDFEVKLCQRSAMPIPNANDKQGFPKKCEAVEETHTSSISTIATSVKSRQRMKRRFTDDIVDTDVGLLSLTSLPSCKKKIKQEPRATCKKAKKVPQAMCKKIKKEPYITCKKIKQEPKATGKKNKQNKKACKKNSKKNIRDQDKKNKQVQQACVKKTPQVKGTSGKKNKQGRQMSGKKNKEQQTSGKKIKKEQNIRGKKIKKPQMVHINDIIKTLEDFKEKLNSVPKTKSITRAEFIFNAKKPPVSHCCCLDIPILLTMTKDHNIFCQAVDSVDDKLVGCCQPVVRYSLIRPSCRIPFTIMCDMHLWRLRNHHCCSRCGRFCSQGTFIRCTGVDDDEKVHHLFHESCVFNVWDTPCCPHCGKNTNFQTVNLNLNLTSSPTSLKYANYYKTNLVARITLSAAPKPTDNTIVKLKSGLGLSAFGLLSSADKKGLENMLKKLKAAKKEDIPNYPLKEFYTAVLEGHTLKALHMLYKGVSPNTKFSEYNSETALHAAAKKDRVLEAHLLVQAGCLIDTLNDCLQTPVMVGTENNNVDIVVYLISRKADVDIRGESGSTCLHLAAKEGNYRMCSVLLRSLKIQLNLQDDGGWTPVVWASEHGHFDIVNLLLKSGADPNIRDKEGNTALHWASFNGNYDICEICCTFGCNVNEVNVHGDTPLHIAGRRDNSKVVEYLLTVNSSCDIKNHANLLPLDCCINDSECSNAIKLHLMMQTILKNKENAGTERIVTSDISFGKERVPIQCVNWFDVVDLTDDDFLYITENCETDLIKMDRSITSLQACFCKNDCASLMCTCANISFKCWYDKDARLVPDFNMFDPPLLFECNRACICDVSSCRNRVVQKGLICRLQLFRTAKKGWGVRTLKDIPKGTFICEYVGELISDSEADKREDDSYLFDLDNRDGETYCLDARHFGNISRFINHLCEPNVVPIKVFVDHQDLGFPRIAFFSARDIAQYEELGFDYGEKFWVIKSKWFTCNCGSPGCKYSSETIKETLASYFEKNSEEQTGTLKLE